MRHDVAPGGVFPDYELPDHTGKLRKLSELQGDDPLILTLARGHYCPKEHQQHLELAAFYPKIAVAYTQIATISTDDPPLIGLRTGLLFCQACFDGKTGKLVALSPPEDWNRGVRRQCPVCKDYFYEKKMDFSSVKRRF